MLTGNQHLMGERFTNSGPLTVAFATAGSATVSRVQIFEGVPQRNGVMNQLVEAGSTTITPSIGEHFYYGKITLNSGRLLWTAPLWVTQIIEVIDSIFGSGFD